MIVLDASALLCLGKNEPGAHIVFANCENSTINTVNWSEVLQKSALYGVNANVFIGLNLNIAPFTLDMAKTAADLYPFTKGLGLSLGDRACLATAILTQSDVLTCERDWDKLNFPGKPKIILAR